MEKEINKEYLNDSNILLIWEDFTKEEEKEFERAYVKPFPLFTNL